MDNGHWAHGCRNAWHLLSLLLSLLANHTASPLSRLGTCHHVDPTSCQAQSDATLPSKVIRRDSLVSVVSSFASSTASAEVALPSVFAAQAELLRYELQGMASLQLVEVIQTLRDVVDSMHGWLLQDGSLLERAEAALGRLSPTTAEVQPPPMSPPLSELDVNFEDGKDVELYGCFSPHSSAASSSLPALSSVGKVSGMSPASVIDHA